MQWGPFLLLDLLFWVINIPMKYIQKQCKNPFKSTAVTFDLCLNLWQQSSVKSVRCMKKCFFFFLCRMTFEVSNKNMQLGTSSSFTALIKKIIILYLFLVCSIVYFFSFSDWYFINSLFMAALAALISWFYIIAI